MWQFHCFYGLSGHRDLWPVKGYKEISDNGCAGRKVCSEGVSHAEVAKTNNKNGYYH